MPAARPQRARWGRLTVWRKSAFLAILMAWMPSAFATPLPSALRGTWRIARILPTKNVSCWDQKQAEALLGSTLTYAAGSMSWKGGTVAVRDIYTRTVTANSFLQDNGHGDYYASFEQIGIRAHEVMEVDMQHEDMDITGATTEVPGDAVLLAGPNRIVVSACGVYFEATRAGMLRASR